jgi:hypothetical protein
MFKKREMKRVFVQKRAEVQEDGENYTMKSFIICTLHQV